MSPSEEARLAARKVLTPDTRIHSDSSIGIRIALALDAFAKERVEAGRAEMRERAAMAVGGFTKERRAGLQPCEVIRSLPLQRELGERK